MKLWLLSFVFVLAGFNAHAQDAHQHMGFKHLTFQKGAVHAHTQWETGPRTPDESILRIDWKKGSDHSPLVPGAFTVKLFMPDMGHGSSPVTITPVKGTDGKDVPGSYRVSKIYFTMGGEWEVRVSLKGPDGKDETQVIPVNLDMKM